MSTKEKGKEENNGEILHHFHHEHPLSLTTVAGSILQRCYGCQRIISPKGIAYTCHDKCGSNLILHEECAEMPREITLSMHPQHTLIQMEKWDIPLCSLCKEEIFRIGYYCKSSDPCSFGIHVGCAQDMKVLKTCIDHPSHPHQLTLLCRPGQSCSFRCDACGTTEKGNSYMCLDCQYWIHESCTALHMTMDFRHHHHALSLVFHVPLEYVKFTFDVECHICFKYLLPRYWVYHCQTCRYVVHIKCAIDNASKLISNMDVNAAEDKDVITFPADNAIEDMIRSFVTKVREEEEEVLQADPNKNYKFHNHNHQLRLISSTQHDQAKEKESVNDDDDDDDEYLQYENKTKLVCDGCTMPISQKKPNKYMSCSECKYFLHLPCSQLPPKLLSHPLHHRNKGDHTLTLQTSPKLNLNCCDACDLSTNGLFYQCTNSFCNFKVDVKCASLPNTIKHSAHPHHLKLLSQMDTSIYVYRPCGGCGDSTEDVACYICNICNFILHSSCCLLPESVTNRTWDKHPVPLTFDPSMDPSNIFYCEVCETEMESKRWMYHCHDCDVSIHPNCLTTHSGEYRNIKFGQRYVVDEVHSHPLSYQLLTKKLRCDVCKERKYHGSRGFQCYSDKCDFFMCLDCGRIREDVMQAVD